MWTPKRVVLLLGGMLTFCAAYGVYSRLLGWLDGLPPLPPEKLLVSDTRIPPPERATSPTVQLLREAFGPDCVEQSSLYLTKLNFPNGESSIVLASGTPVVQSDSKRVSFTPFSLAVFGKPRPPHLRQPGEVTEITTFHADKAVMEFDRPIGGPTDMNKAKLVRMELVSEPEDALPDPRRGMIHVVNNQRSADRNKALVLRTPGPIFYRDPKGVGPPAAGPDIWTDAAIEIVDRQNLPRGYGAPAPATATTRGADLLARGAVPDILAGHRLPPPTVTALGMRIFLDSGDRAKPGAAPPKKGSAGFSGVQRVELLEKVLINLWTDARQALVASPAPTDPATKSAPQARASEPKSANPTAIAEPPAATAAVVGGVFFPAQEFRQLDRALLQIDTPGRFVYDAARNVARFDALPEANPDLLNDVQVHRVLPRGGRQELFSQVLELEFDGPPVGGQPAPAEKPRARPNPDDGALSVKQIHAWAYTAGRFVTVATADEDDKGSDAGGLTAYGRDIVHEQAASRTTLKGSPVQVFRRSPPQPGEKPGETKPGGRYSLIAGEKQEAVLTLTPGPDGSMTARVDGPGRIEMTEGDATGPPVRASWQQWFAHTKEVGQRTLDVLTFTGGAMFEDARDARATNWLKGDELRLWLEPGKGEPAAAAPAGGAGNVKPQRLEANRAVSAESADFVIDRADRLTVIFTDVPPPALPPPPKQEAPAPAPANPMPPPAAGPPDPKAPAPPPEQPKPKPPMRLQARVVDTWVVRYPVQKPPAAKPDPKDRPGDGGAMKYELKQARCEGYYLDEGKPTPLPLVHQEPAEPAPDKKGLDIYGQTLLADQTPNGGVLTVTGTDDRQLGQVNHEGMSIVGPKVVIDQLHNEVEVEGRGFLVMPSGSDLNGAETREPTVVVVHWRDRMKFRGATKLAEFFGKVTAKQNEAYVTCHTLQVQFDRPVEFTPRRKPGDPPPPGGEKEQPKIERVCCYPAPGDERDEPAGAGVVTYSEVIRDATGRIEKAQSVTAPELVVSARVTDPGSKVPYQRVEASGPGTVRVWQPGQKDVAGPGGKPGAPAQPGAAGASPPKPDDTEMKLTIVKFGGRMHARDMGKVYQDATFTDNVDVINAPADRPEAAIDRHRLPPGSVTLKCTDKLVVSTHKQPTGPPAQRMDAVGNALIQTDEYHGWGETITSDGPTVTLKGGDTTLAKIHQRFGRGEQSGKTIIYNRLTGNFEVKDGFNGTFPLPAKKAPPPPMQPGVRPK